MSLVRAAAILIITEDRVVEGLNHYDVRMKLEWTDEYFYYMFESGLVVEGFVDDTGKFLTREEAEEIAIAAEQITTPEHEQGYGLLSEQIENNKEYG